MQTFHLEVKRVLKTVEYGNIEIEANTLQEAIDKAGEGIGEDIDVEYTPHSIDVESFDIYND
jgi:hypothetical protein